MLHRAPLITNPLSETGKIALFSTDAPNADAYLKRYVEIFLDENRISKAYESKKSRNLRLILLGVIALLLALDIVYKAFYHKSLLWLVILAAGAYLIIHFRNLHITRYLMAEVKRRPFDPIDNILASQISGACRRLFTTILGLVPIAAVLIAGAICFSQPHIIYERNDLGGYSIRYYTLALHREERIVLPETYRGLPVNEIRGETFYNMRFTSIELPPEIREIRGNTFQKCKRLRSIEIPEGVTRIGGHAFDGCVRLEEVELPDSLTEIGASAFRGCKKLSSVELPDSLATLGQNAFRECESLTEIELPDGLTEISQSAFRLCTGLEYIHIPDGVTAIRESAFRGCTRLEEVWVPYSVKTVERRAFAYCDRLMKIRIPEHATIDSEAFENSPTKVSVY